MKVGQSKLLDIIGAAQMEQEIIKDVTKIDKEQSVTIEESTGVVPSTTIDEIREYVQIVMKEVKGNPAPNK